MKPTRRSIARSGRLLATLPDALLQSRALCVEGTRRAVAGIWQVGRLGVPPREVRSSNRASRGWSALLGGQVGTEADDGDGLSGVSSYSATRLVPRRRVVLLSVHGASAMDLCGRGDDRESGAFFRYLQVDSSRQTHSLPVLSFLQAMYSQHEMANVIVPNDPPFSSRISRPSE